MLWHSHLGGIVEFPCTHLYFGYVCSNGTIELKIEDLGDI